MIKTKKTNHIFIYGSPLVVIIVILMTMSLRNQPRNGFPPENMANCTVILGAKFVGPGHVIIDPLAALSGARHLFVNYFFNQTSYGIIEGGFIPTKFGYRGLSTAHIKLYAWDHGGLQWQVPVFQCKELIDCLHTKTIEYHHSSHPYNFLLGPNSNSFIWWIFAQCSIEIKSVFSKYPFVGIDYFWLQNFPSENNLPT